MDRVDELENMKVWKGIYCLLIFYDYEWLSKVIVIYKVRDLLEENIMEFVIEYFCKY